MGDGLNGFFGYGSGPVFPGTVAFANGANYWVDVVFNDTSSGPQAVNDSGFSTAENTAINLGASQLLANDTDPDGLSFSLTGVSGPVNGTVTYNSQTQAITFTPTTGYVGAASFAYTITDTSGATGTGYVSVNVTNPTNDQTFFAPTATPASPMLPIPIPSSWA